MKTDNSLIFIIITSIVFTLLIVVTFSLAVNLGVSERDSTTLDYENKMTLDAFSKIDLQSNVDLEIIQSDEYSIKMLSPSTFSNNDDVRYSIKDSKLTIFTNTKINTFDYLFDTSPQPKIVITTPTLEEIKVLSSAYVSSLSFTTDKLYVDVNGSGSIELNNISATEVKSVISGSGVITMSGDCNIHESLVTGSGWIESNNLISQTSKAKVIGSGSIELNAQDYLDAHLEGSGSIIYYGNPTVTKSITGSGIVKKE